MAFDQKTRNLLQRTVSACRRLLDEEFAAQRRSLYAIYDDGTAAPLDTLTHLPDEEQQTARLLRDRLNHLVAGLLAQGKKDADARKEAVGRLTREQAFTVLNRLAALRMAEERDIVLECVRRGLQSDGFELFLQQAGAAFKDRFGAYRAYLSVLFDELAIDLGVLFDRHDAAGLLFPRLDALEAVLAELGGSGLANKSGDTDLTSFRSIWAEDETIGWIYQYYNDPDERKKMREESSAPRNSRELAVRNQFFTPRYVVEFLTDNTLGRLWYEMTNGRTTLKEQCRYLVRRPNEIFLHDCSGIFPSVRADLLKNGFTNLPDDPTWDELQAIALSMGDYPYELSKQLGLGECIEFAARKKQEFAATGRLEGGALELFCCLFAEQRNWKWSGWGDHPPPEDLHRTKAIFEAFRRALDEKQDGESQEQLLKKPVFIPPRAIKDPREIRLLDPACGSMHFGLYAFDLFETIYEEAWSHPEVGRRLQADYGVRPREPDHLVPTSISLKIGAPLRCMLSGRTVDKTEAVIALKPHSQGAKERRGKPLLCHRDEAARRRGQLQGITPLEEFSFIEALRDQWFSESDARQFFKESGAFAYELIQPTHPPTLDEAFARFRRDIPRLIIEHNIHGIDIDPRCAQIAGLSLWLRAQKAWQRLGLKPAERPVIKRSNIVCAEPMPGEKELLREFVEREFPAAERAVCLRLLEAIFDKMQLAGEAGSLLKIEEEIRSAIEDARDAWQKLATKPQELFTTTELNQISTAPELTGLEQAVSSLTTDPATRHLTTDFWESIEERIYAALRNYAEQAENGGGLQRRLFAEDAARGFAFIDVCRKRYDVALMNPPFGDFSKQWKDEAREAYPNSYNDILGTFVDSFLHRLSDGGRLGAITSRTCFFLTSFTKWRTKVVLERATMGALADLGHGVMDDAMVEAAAYVLQRLSPIDVAIRRGENRPSIPRLQCFRILKDTEKESALLKAISSQRSENLFLADPSAFALASGNAFTYWVSPSTLRKLNEHPPIEDSLVTIRVGLQTGDDWRFLRQWWEVSTQSIALNLPKMAGTSRNHAELRRTLSQHVADGCEWVFYSKTDYAAPWYSPLLQVVNWKEDGKQFFHFVDAKGKLRSRPQNLEFYLRPGFSYMLRSFRLVPYLVPAGAIPTAGRAQAFPLTDDTLAPLAICASNLGSAVARFNGEMFARPKFQASMVQSIPSCNFDAGLLHELLDFVRAEVSRRRQLFQGHEPFIEFVRPAWLIGAQGSLSWRRESLLGNELEWKIAEAYGLTKSELAELERDIFESIASQSQTSNKESSNDEGDDSAEIIDESEAARVEGGLSYVLGVAFGRWDIRYATGEQAAPELPDPFAPLPVCPPGQLQNAQGLPARPEDVPAAYPVRIPWDGILVDDPDHPLDLERRVREVIEIIWSGKDGGPTAEAIEHEACEILGVKSLRDYFRKPAGFFADHLKRYSKSRRQAPIYWPLSTASGSYTLWIYYHRLNSDTLYKCLQQFVEPKRKEVEVELERLSHLEKAGEISAKERKHVESLEELRRELGDMQAELEHWAPRWKPNLNDGVLITAAPLWKLFRLPKWQKDLKACWSEMEKGDYDWAHLALTLWPDRVREKCRKDRSLAIAHGLEELCEVKAPEPKAKRGRKAKQASPAVQETGELIPEPESSGDQ